jgi:DNA adenine methylase
MLAGNRAKIINVATVPQRSPFRYPGGKTWLIPYVRQWLRGKADSVKELIEPFAGGAIVGLTAGFETLVERVSLIERDPDVAAVWRTIFHGNGQWLADQIVVFEISAESVRAVLSARSRSTQERAFATILRNRVQRGGILAPGAGLMKVGENGKGIKSRWYPETLCRRIMGILAIKGRFHFVEGDGVQFLEKNAGRKDVVFFIDPPYTVAGRRLYSHSEIDHEKLFHLVSTLAGDFLMTYDNAKEIRALAARFKFDTEPIPMKSTHHAQKTELLVGRDLNWARIHRTVQLTFPEFVPRMSRG